ncbi:recombinase family protein [Burkholderia stagnalis]|uniref:recombinase family protein n=1 Tax=Burkholderia stagnalis TaxID=1503054 RepID=UPI0009BEAEA6
MKIGYARVSTDEQHLDLQLHALQQSGCDQIFSDRGMSGARTDRPGLRQALAAIQPGDTLTVWKLDRLGRSLGHLVTIIGDLDRSGVRVVSLTEAIDTRSSAGRFTFHLIAALAEFERSLISERTRAGLAAARRRGRKPGRPAVLDAQKLEKARALLAYKSEVAVARILNVHQRTLRRKLEVTCDGNEPSSAKQDAPHDPAHLTGPATPLLEYSWCRQEIFEVENTATSGFYRSRAQWRRIKLLSPGKKPRMSVGASMPPSRAIALQYALRWK